jgi:hydroxyacylglutathione hydrolase
MKLSLYTGGFVQTNGYLVETPDGNLLIDAPEGVTEWLAGRGTRVDDVLLTHQHYDHVMDAAKLKEGGSRLHAFADYSPDLTLETAVRSWGLPVTVAPYQVDKIFDMASPLKIAGLEFSLAHVPGHSTDSVTFHLASHGLVFSGDTLFASSIGRPDLPGGNVEQLLDGIGTHLMTLPPETRVYPGHGHRPRIRRESLSGLKGKNGEARDRPCRLPPVTTAA